MLLPNYVSFISLLLESESPVVSLLFLHPDFPLSCDFHVVVFEPNEVLSVSPVWWSYVFKARLEPIRNVGLDVPILLAINDEWAKPRTFNVTNLLLHVFDLRQVFDFNGILSVELFSRFSWVFDRITLIKHSNVVVFLAAFSLLPKSWLLIGAELDNSLIVVSEIFEENVSMSFNSPVTHDCST